MFPVNRSIFIALGSNMGDRAENIRQGAGLVAALPGTTIVACSPLFETEAVGPVRQGNFLNGAMAIASTLPPAALLQALLRIESEDFGRSREVPGGPRRLDLDLLFYGDMVISSGPDLIVPHPRLHERRFVLAPLAIIAPDFTHPVIGKTVSQLLDELPLREHVIELQRVPCASSSG
jgi:2-amino-4-hydroxy-6-hydroxymethyldihydropteridine diphosphokinase